MKPKAKPRTHEQPLIATMRLDLALDMDQELVSLAATIPWDRLAEESGPLLLPSEWYQVVQMTDMLGRAMSAVNLHRLGLQRGLAKLEAILGPKLDAFGYTKDTWGTVYPSRAEFEERLKALES